MVNSEAANLYCLSSSLNTPATIIVHHQGADDHNL